MCAHLLVDAPEQLRGHWLDEFKYNTLHLELGCGKGRFTVETAGNEPDVLLVAIEKTANVLIAAMERVKCKEIHNIRFINALADDLKSFFSEDEVSRIYINFCDPWPANRHVKRRLTSQRFLELYKYILSSSGEIQFKTDNLPLFEFSLKEFEYCGFLLSEISYNLHEQSQSGVMTDYELKFHEQGVPIYRCVAKKCSLDK